jgi:hypothetical protein
MVLAVRPDEKVIRRDLVAESHSITGKGWRLARMVLTNQRIFFQAPGLPTHQLSVATAGQILWWAEWDWPLLRPFSIELGEIDRIWKWQPEFSGPPMVSIHGDCWSFQLLEDRFPWKTSAPLDQIREHFFDVEKAWTSARS